MSLPASELRSRRQNLGLTQAQLAERLGVQANTVARWERGELKPIHPEHVARQLAQLERTHARRPSVSRRAPRQPSQQNNVPAQLSTFIGREDAIAEIRITILIGTVLLLGRGTDAAASLSMQQTVTHALDNNTPSTPGRLISAKLTGSGDATVEFVLSDRDHGQANRAAALADVLAIARAVRDP